MAGRERKAEEIAAWGNLVGRVVAVIAAIGGVAAAADASTWLKVILAVAVAGGALVLVVLHLLERRAARRETGLAAGAYPRMESTRETRKRRIRLSVVLGACAVLLAEAVILVALIQGSDHDRDNDGVLDPPSGADCGPGDPRIKPGAADKPENGIDENCDGADAHFPEFDPRPTWRIEHRRSGSLTLIRGITVRDVPAKATVELRCSGTDCKRTTRRFFRRSAAEVRLVTELRRTVRGRTGAPIALHPATKIEIRVTKPLFTGEGVLIEISRRGPPTYRTFCIGQKEKRECRP